MSKINRLSPHMANLIAAGEVVERPASVVKELMENSIDAGSPSVSVEITAGGIASIRVADAGCGIARDDIETAFLPHATSKVSTEDDLHGIQTLGFRGEALASIAAVSRTKLFSRTTDEQTGWTISLDGGAVTDIREAGGPVGTVISVSDLFYNTPARHKFLKRDATEASYVQSVCRKTALAHPEVSVKLVKAGITDMHTPGDGRLYSAIYCIYGRELAGKLTEVGYELNGVSVSGYVSAPSDARGSRSMQFFFVNSRPVKSATVQAALEDAFSGRMIGGRFPCAFLNIKLDHESVDVNVHPAKAEVRFSNDKAIFEAVYYSVKRAVAPEQTSPTAVEEDAPAVNPPEIARGAEPLNVQIYKKDNISTPPRDIIDSVKPYLEQSPELLTVSDPEVPVALSFAGESEPSEPEAEPAAAASAPELRVIGEAFGVYILVQCGDELWLVDKHAAHERLRYDELMKSSKVRSSQYLAVPSTVALSSEEKSALCENAELLAEAGFEFEDFGGASLLLRAVPEEYVGADLVLSLSEIAKELLLKGSYESRRSRLMKTVACKHAIRAGDENDISELEELVKRMLAGGVTNCPHGRPVCVKFSRRELEKRFERIT